MWKYCKPVDVMFSKACINNLEIFLKMFLFNIGTFETIKFLKKNFN